MNVERIVVDVLKMELAKVITGMSEEDVYKTIYSLVGRGYKNIDQFDKELEAWLMQFVKVSLPYVAEFLYTLMLQIAKQEGIIK